MLDSLTSRVAKLEEAMKALDASIGDLQNSQGAGKSGFPPMMLSILHVYMGVVQQAIANETAAMEDIHQIKVTLNAMEAKLDNVDGCLTQTNRIQRLVSTLVDSRLDTGTFLYSTLTILALQVALGS